MNREDQVEGDSRRSLNARNGKGSVTKGFLWMASTLSNFQVMGGMYDHLNIIVT